MVIKLKVISFGRNADKTHMYKISNKDTDVTIERVDTIRERLNALIWRKIWVSSLATI